MGKVTVLISITPGGFADAENVIIDPEFFDFTHLLMSKADMVAFGKSTFEIFQDRWPQRLLDETAPQWVRDMAKALHGIPKVVFSSTLKDITWYNATIINKLDTDYIKSFKQSDVSMLIFGSPGLINALTELSAVDDYYFNIQPMISGNGKVRLFDKIDTSLPLKFISCKQMASGANIMHYQPKKL